MNSRNKQIAALLAVLAALGLVFAWNAATGNERSDEPGVMRDVGVDSDGFIIQESTPSGTLETP